MVSLREHAACRISPDVTSDDREPVAQPIPQHPVKQIIGRWKSNRTGSKAGIRNEKNNPKSSEWEKEGLIEVMVNPVL